MLSKEEVSDLKSHIDRLVETKLAFYTAELVKTEAEHSLETFLWHQEYDKKCNS